MKSCDELRVRLAEGLDGPVADPELDAHLEQCPECRAIADSLSLVGQAAGLMAAVEPSPRLRAELTASPCRYWLGLLFRAVDRELDENGLARLLAHLESCDSCRRAWGDLALIHQVGEALVPAAHLVRRCTDVPFRFRVKAVLSRRTAAVAAYLLAASATIAIGNPVSLARQRETLGFVQNAATAVSSQIGEVTEGGRGEVKVMVWRVWNWAGRQLWMLRDAARQAENESPQTKQGG